MVWLVYRTIPLRYHWQSCGCEPCIAQSMVWACLVTYPIHRENASIQTSELLEATVKELVKRVLMSINIKELSFNAELYISFAVTSWNQSMHVQLMTAGNFLPLTRRVLPTGEKQRTTFNCRRTRSMKNFQQFSLVSWIPAPFTSFLSKVTIFSTSSSENKSGISPDAKRLLIKTKNFSSATWASVIRNTVPKFFTPVFWYKFAKSIFKSWLQ